MSSGTVMFGTAAVLGIAGYNKIQQRREEMRQEDHAEERKKRVAKAKLHAEEQAHKSHAQKTADTEHFMQCFTVTLDVFEAAFVKLRNAVDDGGGNASFNSLPLVGSGNRAEFVRCAVWCMLGADLLPLPYIKELRDHCPAFGTAQLSRKSASAIEQWLLQLKIRPVPWFTSHPIDSPLQHWRVVRDVANVAYINDAQVVQVDINDAAQLRGLLQMCHELDLDVMPKFVFVPTACSVEPKEKARNIGKGIFADALDDGYLAFENTFVAQGSSSCAAHLWSWSSRMVLVRMRSHIKHARLEAFELLAIMDAMEENHCNYAAANASQGDGTPLDNDAHSGDNGFSIPGTEEEIDAFLELPVLDSANPAAYDRARRAMALTIGADVPKMITDGGRDPPMEEWEDALESETESGDDSHECHEGDVETVNT
eukprot:g7029.t1